MSPVVQEIFRQLEKHRDRLRTFGIRRLALFGSAVRDRMHQKSDLDFLVEFEKKTFDNYMGLKLLLEEIFGRRVDLVMPSALKTRLKPLILNETIDAPGF